MPLRPLREALGTWSPGRSGSLEPIHAIAAAWPGIVGSDVAANSQPLELSGTALVIVTTSSAWSQQLQMLSLPILRGLRDLPQLPPIERLTFRAGTVRGRKRRTPAAAAAAKTRSERPAQTQLPPAADAAEALQRLRRRMTAARRTLGGRCSVCAAPIEPDAARCAPCAGAAELERSLTLQRIIYAAPWLVFEEIREQLAGTTVAEYERARRVLLQRWWTVLERAKRAGTLSRSGVERGLASSYVLLQSRLRPDRITPAVVRNLLGADLEALLWPGAAGKAPAADLSKPTHNE
jgi:hypothetical protein